MATSTKYAGTIAEVSSFGYPWTNADEAHLNASDNSYMTCAIDPEETTNVLSLSNFGFAIPVGATIDNVEITVEGKKSTGEATVNASLCSDAPNGTDIGNSAISDNLGTSEAALTGDARLNVSDMPTLAQINATAFGLRFNCSDFSADGGTISVDAVSLTVTYTAAASEETVVIKDPVRGESRSILTAVDPPEQRYILNAGYYYGKTADLAASIDEGNLYQMPKWIGGGSDFDGRYLTATELDRYCDVRWRPW